MDMGVSLRMAQAVFTLQKPAFPELFLPQVSPKGP